MRRRLVWLPVVAAATANHGVLHRRRPTWAAAHRRQTKSPLAANCDLAPVALAPLGEGQLAVLNSLGRLFLVVDGTTGKRTRWMEIPAEGSGLAVDDENRVCHDLPTCGDACWRSTGNRVKSFRQWHVGAHAPPHRYSTMTGTCSSWPTGSKTGVRSIDLETGEQRTVDVVSGAGGPGAERPR